MPPPIRAIGHDFGVCQARAVPCTVEALDRRLRVRAQRRRVAAVARLHEAAEIDAVRQNIDGFSRKDALAIVRARLRRGNIVRADAAGNQVIPPLRIVREGVFDLRSSVSIVCYVFVQCLHNLFKDFVAYHPLLDRVAAHEDGTLGVDLVNAAVFRRQSDGRADDVRVRADVDIKMLVLDGDAARLVHDGAVDIDVGAQLL